MKKFIAYISITTMLTGCSLVPDYKMPSVKLHEKWQNSEEKVEKVDTEWWKNFKSSKMQQIVNRSLQNNNDVNAAKQRLLQARAQATIAGAPLLPSADLSANYSRSGTRLNNNSNFNNS